MDNAKKPNGVPMNILAFSTAAAATAAVVGIATYIFLSKRIVVDPQEILSRAQAAIQQIETDLRAVI